MNHDNKSIAEQIESLARLTGAPESFVDQVRELFTRKGISLDEDSAPYMKALEEAFIREESIRASARQARTAMTAPGTDFRKIGKVYVQQLERLRRAQAGRRGRRRASGSSETDTEKPAVEVGPSSQGLVTRQQNEDLPMVPGPEDLQ